MLHQSGEDIKKKMVCCALDIACFRIRNTELEPSQACIFNLEIWAIFYHVNVQKKEETPAGIDLTEHVEMENASEFP